MIEALSLLTTERVDRRLIEQLFDLRHTAAHRLIERLGAELCGHSLVISRDKLMARLREIEEHPDWRWERKRRAKSSRALRLSTPARDARWSR